MDGNSWTENMTEDLWIAGSVVRVKEHCKGQDDLTSQAALGRVECNDYKQTLPFPKAC